jgi:ABC-type uncharacterized transport system permease subunit
MFTSLMPHLWLRVAVFLYGLGLVYALISLITRREIQPRIILPKVGLAAVFHFVAIIEATVVGGRLAPLDSSQVPSIAAFVLMLFFFGIYWRYKITSHGMFVFPLVFLFTLSSSIATEPPQFESSLMRSGWIWGHIALIFIGYAALFVSFASSVLYLLQERRLKSKRTEGFLAKLPALAVVDDIGLRSLVLGFPFMTLGLIAGSVIAQTLFGPTYFKDPKVVLSLLMWAVYMLLLFTRWAAGWRGRRAATLSAVAFLSATLAWAATYASSMRPMLER